jgi:serine protease
VSFRLVHLLRLALPAALVAGALVGLTGSSGSAAEPGPYRPSFTARHNPDKPEYEPNSVLVKFKKNATTSARNAALVKANGKSEVSVTADYVKVTGDVAAPDLLKKVKADPTVELVSLNYIRTATATPNDPYYANYQKHLSTARVNQAWDLSKSAGNQVVAVLDSGVDAGHPDLAGHLLPGYNTFNTALPPADGFGHGTMMAGIIAAGTNNSIGVAGVAWSAKVRPVKVLDDNGRGADSNIINGINWAVANGARVISLSLSAPGYNSVLDDVINKTIDRGVVVIAAAGNGGSGVPQYPGAYYRTLAVGATNGNGVLTSFSTYGNWVDLAAPGWDVTSTGPRARTPAGVQPYWTASGTSFSAAIVAGTAALVRNKWPTLTADQVVARLKATARDAGPRGRDSYYGAGVLDAYASLGGPWTADFPGGVGDGNDNPSRATRVGLGTSLHAMDTEGDVDWYYIEAPDTTSLKVTVTGPVYDESRYSVNFGPRIEVYNDGFVQLAAAQNVHPVGTAPAALTVSVGAANYMYVAVTNWNGSRDTRKYTLSITEEQGGGDSGVGHYPVYDVFPADQSSGVPLTVAPTVRLTGFQNGVNEDEVFLENGRTGVRVPTTFTADGTLHDVKLTPLQPLEENTPYRIRLPGVLSYKGGVSAEWTSVFTTVNLTPQKLSAFTGTGAYLAANLAWTIPPTPDLDQVIVRRNVGSTAPTPTTGTLVYAGTGTAVKNTGLAQNTTYTYAAWVKDRGGKYSPIAVKQLLGMKSGIATTSTLINYGGSITIKGSTLRIDNLAYAGLPVNVYVRPKNVSTFKLLAALKTSSTGTLSIAHKPLVSSVYMLTFPGNADLMGTRTADITVQVRPTISATLSPATIRLGQATAFIGYVAPAHYGKPVYLQQYSNRVWKSIASVKLSSSGKYAFGIKPAIRGQIAYRVWFPADADHAQAFTANKILTIS